VRVRPLTLPSPAIAASAGEYEVPDLTSKKIVLQLRNWNTGNMDQVNSLALSHAF